MDQHAGVSPERILQFMWGYAPPYSFEEIAGWLRDAGFEQPRPVETPGGASPLILATRPDGASAQPADIH